MINTATHYPRLAQPGRLGRLLLKNRAVMAPMGTNYSTTDGLSTDRDKQYYVMRAKGGVGMIMTEAMVVTEHARPHLNSLCCYHDRFIPGLANMVDEIKQHDCHVFGQLNHRGALLRRSVLNMEPVGPSPWINPNTGDPVRALSLDEIVDIQKLFVASARRLWLAGYDGVEIHAANGYLFQQFFSPRINQRTDHYGGSLRNRMRMLLETVARVRDAIPELCLIVRLSASEFVEGGYSSHDIIALAQALENAGVDAIDLSGGSNESPQLSKFCIQPPSFPRGCLVTHAKPIKAALSIPVLMAGRIVSPQDAEDVLACGAADFVSIGRALYADPFWCDKAFGKIQAPIRECIACNVCFDRLTLEQDVSCVQNPMIGTEFEALEYTEPQLFAHPTIEPRRVMVIGAGVAGVEAARMLKGKGHTVEVWEAKQQPGGQVPLAMAAPDKTEIAPIWTYRWDSLNTLGVPVHLGATVSLEDIQAFSPDHIIMATGSLAAPHPIDVSQVKPAIKVIHAWEALDILESFHAGMQVTIVGGGMVGAEVADALRVRGVRITVLERLPTIATGMARNNRFELVERLGEAGVKLKTNCRIIAINNDHIALQQGDSPIEHIAIGDCLIFATGPKPALSVLDAIQASGVPYTRVGDCNRPGDFLAAIRDASMAALFIDRITPQLKNRRPHHEQAL